MSNNQIAAVAGIQLSEETMGWILDLAHDDQQHYLTYDNPQEDYGQEWPDEARNRAKMCREVSAAVRIAGEAQRWEDLALSFEGSICEESSCEEPDIDDTVHCCPNCERPNQFGELCSNCERESEEEGQRWADEHEGNPTGGKFFAA